MQDQDIFEVEKLSDGSTNFFKGKGASAAFYYFVLDETGERWLAKGIMYDPNAQILPSLQAVQSEIAKERLANGLYAQFGIPVARLGTAFLPAYFKAGSVWQEIAQELALEELPAVLSRFLDHFNDYGYLPNLKTDKPYFELLIDDQPFPEVGLGRVLAVTQWVGDVDAIGGSGGNVGYRLRQHPDKGLLVETCKIDPGGAFFEFEKSQCNEVNPVIQLAQQGGEEIYTTWQDWSPQTQAEYWETIKTIIDLSEHKLIAIFETTDPQKHYQDYDLCLIRLKARQAHLRELYQAYENTVQNKPQKVIALPELTHMQSDDPIIRLETSQQLMLSSNTVQQAFHFYLPPFVLIDANLSLDNRRDWEEELIRFTKNPQKKCLLLLGPAGAGKSIESLRCIRFAQTAGYIPLRIELKRFTENTVGQCVINTLKDDYQLTDIQIEQLKTQPLLIILDGYDEIAGRPRINLYDSNRLVEWTESKVLITCRSQYFTREMRGDFIPSGNTQALQEWHLAPLDENQIQNYLQRYHAEHPDFELDACLEYLKQHQETKALLNTPLMLKLLVEAWPYLNQKNQRLTRYDLYEAFFTSWETLQEVRTIQQLGKFEKLIPIFRQFSEDLAWALYAHEQESVNYTGEQADPMWDRFFTDQDPEVVKARLGCPLTRKGTEYSFIHKSFADHLVARRLWLSLTNDAFEACLQKWNQRFLVDERAILNIMAEKLQGLSPKVPEIKCLFKLIKASKHNPKNAKAASSAISVLNHGNKMLIRKDFRQVHIPYADLSNSCCREANFMGANLQSVNFREADLRDTSFEKANMAEVIFGERAYLKFSEKIMCITYSQDRCWMAVSFLGSNDITVIDTGTGETRYILEGHYAYIYSISFSPQGNLIASGSADNTVRLWLVESGQCCYTLRGHTKMIRCVAFSPHGDLIASGSFDNTVRLWSVESGQCCYILRKNVSIIAFSPNGDWLASSESGNDTVYLWEVASGQCQHTLLKGYTQYDNDVVFSPQGDLIASVSKDNTIRLWVVESGQLQHTLQGHTKSVTSVAFSPRGDLIASGSRDNTVRLWDVQTGETKHTFTGHAREVKSLAFSPRGDLIASGSEDLTVRLWAVESGQLQHTFQGHTDGVNSVAFSPQGDWLASVSGYAEYYDTVRLWEIVSDQYRHSLQGHTKWVNSVAFSPQGDLIVSGGDNTVRLWAAGSGQLLYTFQGHTNSVNSVAFSPQGDLIVSGSTDQTVRLWAVESGQLLYIFQGHTNSVNSVAFSPQGDLIVSGGDNTVRLWAVESGQLQHTFQGHTKSVNSVAFSPHGDLIASGSPDETLCLWEVESGQLRYTFQLKKLGKPGQLNFVNSVLFSPQGDLIASGSNDNAIRLWAVENGQLQRTFQGHVDRVYSVKFSPQGDLIASGSADKTIRLWAVDSGQLQHTFQGHTQEVCSVAFSLQGNLIASGSADKTIRLWAVDSGQLLYTFQGHTKSVNSVAFSPQGDLIVSGSGDNTVRLWAAGNGQLQHTFQGHTNSVNSVAFSPQGDFIVSGSTDQTVCLWVVGSGQLQRTFRGHTREVSSVAFSPHGNLIASGSFDETLCLWEVESGQLRYTFQLKKFGKPGESNFVNSVLFSPQGDLIASGSNDNAIRLWAVENGQLQHTFQGHTNSVNSVAFSPQGDCLASVGGWDMTVRLWSVETGMCLQVIESSSNVSSVAFNSKGNQLVIGIGNTFQCFERRKQGLFQLVWSVPSSEVLQLKNCHIHGAIGLSPNNLALMKQQGAIEDHIQIEEIIEVSSDLAEKVIQPHIESQTFQQRLQAIGEALGISLELIRSYSPGFLKPLSQTSELACVLGTLIVNYANINYPQKQAQCTAGEGDTFCLALTLNSTEREKCLLFYQQHFEGLVISGERSGHLRMKLVLNATIFEEKLLPVLAEYYRAQQQNPKQEEKCFVM